MKHHLYYYSIELKRIYDGDTIIVDIDLGLGTWLRDAKLRLARIQAPEVRGASRPLGLAAKEYMRGLIEGKKLYLKTQHDKVGKFGRYLAELFAETPHGEFQNVNDKMLQAGHAKLYGS